MAQIVGIGANVKDTLFQLETYPTQDTKQGAKTVKEAGGGPCGTGLVAAAKLGATCAYIGNCSDDSVGAFLREDFKKYGVSTQLMRTIPDTIGFCSCIWLADDEASRTCVYHRGTVPPTCLDEEMKSAIAEAQLLMVDGNDLDAAVAGATYARAHGTTVLYDAGGRYPNVERLLAVTDLLIPSEEFALGHTGKATVEEAAKELFARYCPKVVVITQGKKGGILYDGEKVLTYPAFPVEAVDTNGSGDVFHGAFAAAYVRGMDYPACCRFASAEAALKCTKVGARAAVPTWDEAMTFIESRETLG
jgi:sugar/nucleoside kinase (ribokinase family)